jgi:hypothetical protein
MQVPVSGYSLGHRKQQAIDNAKRWKSRMIVDDASGNTGIV